MERDGTMRKPSDEQFATAIAWLTTNDGEEGEAEACRAVAEWLRDQQHETFLRSEARKARVPVAALRRKLSELKFGAA
jgi:hypothetical protein